MELPFHYSMLKQVTRIKYALRAAPWSVGTYSGMMRGSINLPLPMISLFSEELPLRAQNKKRNLQDEREGARVLPRSPPEIQRRPAVGSGGEERAARPGPSASSGGGSGEVQDEALGPRSWHAGERRERDRGLNWGKNHLRDF